jgi:hypothetical protein
MIGSTGTQAYTAKAKADEFFKDVTCWFVLKKNSGTVKFEERVTEIYSS